MSFSLPPVKPKPEAVVKLNSNDDKYGVPDYLANGFSSVRSSMESSHPLMASERNYQKHKESLHMAILQNTQGLHAPLRISMEMKAASKVGRLPFMPSSNVMLDSLTGRDLEIGPDDVFNLPEFQENLRKPHAMVERSLGLL